MGLTDRIKTKLHDCWINSKMSRDMAIMANTHLSGEDARLREIAPGVCIYARPSFSDAARINEYRSSIYVPNCELTTCLRNYSPTALIDIGANIGLSSLSIVKALPTLSRIVGVEAEQENFRVLEKNFGLWDKTYMPEFQPIYGIATSRESGDHYASHLPGGLSASGTFMFTRANPSRDRGGDNDIAFGKPVTMTQLFNRLRERERVIMKVDIEGGEEDLFSENTTWMRDVAYLTIEVHDRFGRIRSSKGLLECLVDYDFAIYPCEDILHCYNRKIVLC